MGGSGGGTGMFHQGNVGPGVGEGVAGIEVAAGAGVVAGVAGAGKGVGDTAAGAGSVHRWPS